jgi:hypothetical protein
LSLDASTVPETLGAAAPKWLLSVIEWNELHHSTVETLALFGEASAAATVERKRAFVGALAHCITQRGVDLWGAWGADAVLKCMRILSRDKLGAEPLLSAAFSVWLLDLCQLTAGARNGDSGGDDDIDAFALDDPRTEAWALLVNLTINPGATHLLDALAHRHAHRTTLAKLKRSGDADFSLFSRFRLLLQLAAKREDVCRELLDAAVLPLLAAKLRALLRDKSSLQVDSALRQLPVDGLSYVEDLFRCHFIVTVQWGPVGRRPGSTEPMPTMSDADQSALFEVLGYARLVLRNEPVSLAQRAASLVLTRLHGVRAAAVSALLNTPAGEASLEFVQRGQSTADGSDVSFLANHLDNLLRDGAETPRDQLVTLLMLVHRMARAHPDAYHELRETVFPAARYARGALPVGVEVPYADEDTMTNRLVKLMSDSNPAVSHYAQEVLFTLCGENQDEFTRNVGFGSAAGLLAMRGFMKLPDDPLEKRKSSASSSPAAVAASSTSSPALSDEAARLLRQFNAKPEGESDEAREIRQGRAMHDLEKLGVVKMVRKGDDASAAAAAPSLPRTNDERLAAAESLKKSGAASFKTIQYEGASRHFFDGLRLLADCDATGETGQRVRDLQLSLLLNLAICWLKLEKWTQAVETCTDALKIDATNSKALFRRATALEQLGELDKALVDAKAATPTDDPAIEALVRRLEAQLQR